MNRNELIKKYEDDLKAAIEKIKNKAPKSDEIMKMRQEQIDQYRAQIILADSFDGPVHSDEKIALDIISNYCVNRVVGHVI